MDRSKKSYVTPVALSMGLLAGLNSLWQLPSLSENAQAAHSLLVYLIGGSGLALLLLQRALQDGRLTKRDIGLDISGWRPWQRLFGVTMIVIVSYGMYANLQPPPKSADSANSVVAENPGVDTPGSPETAKIARKPSWGDFCFWYVLLLAASLAELLVFIGVGFCMVKRGLQQRGMNSWKATTLAAVFASFTFGIYHYTHAPSWWPLVFFPLMPVMLFNVICFILTRNFYLTLGLHATFAAIGMTQAQFSDPVNNNPVTPQQPAIFAPALISFAIPFLLLHWLEWKGVGPKTETRKTGTT